MGAPRRASSDLENGFPRICRLSDSTRIPFNEGSRNDHEWSTVSPNLLFKVPQSLLKANPEAYEPCLFHLSPYAPNFFDFSSLLIDHDTDGAPSTSADYNAECCCLKDMMVEDLVGAEMFEALVKKISEYDSTGDISLLKMYPERPRNMDAIPPEKLATLFAASAAIVTTSFIFYGSSHALEVRKINGTQSPSVSPTICVRHPIINRYYAIHDAIILMKNQIPIHLLKLACEVLCETKNPRFILDFVEEHQLLKLLRDLVDKTQVHAMRLLVYILRMSLKFVSPFHVSDDSMWELEDLGKAASWINDNPHKPLMAYIYDSLVVETSIWESHRILRLQSDNPVDERDTDWGWPSQCRMVSASQLRSWGVKFRAEKNGGFRGICFDERTTTLTLPVITLQDTTMPFLCNLMAYELTTKLEAESNLQHVASYVLFLDFLIDKEEDVEVLAEAGVLRNYMAKSNASVAKMLDGLVEAMVVDLTPDHNYIVKKLRRACRRRRWRWWASFKETYWEKQPWLLISIAAAAMLLVLTFLQTFYTVKQN